MRETEMVTSWVIREKETGRVIAETFNKEAVIHLNTERYEAVPILQYLQEINRAAQDTPPAAP